MKSIATLVATLSLIVAAVALCAPGPNASSEHFVVTNNNSPQDNSGTIFRLAGTRSNPVLHVVKTLDTGEPTPYGGLSTPNVQVVRSGADICVFLTEPLKNGNELTSFKYPGLALVGNYTLSQVTNSEYGIGIAAHGGYLFAAYGDNISYTATIATWQIGSGCALTLASTYIASNPINSLAVTPNGETLVVAYAARSDVDSFSIGTAGALTEHGPYYEDALSDAEGLDITRDSEYAIFDGQCSTCYPNYPAFLATRVINSDGSLGAEDDWGGDEGGLGPGGEDGWVRLSPNEKFLFVNNGGGGLTTLNFSETPRLTIGYSGCYTTLKNNGVPTVITGAMGTALNSGSGAGLYVSEMNDPDSGVALLSVNPSTGCTTEVPGSPFPTGQNGGLNSLVSWPPRPF